MFIKANHMHPFRSWGFVDAIHQPIGNPFPVYFQGGGKYGYSTGFDIRS
jgi:hypothetical protein